MSAGAAGRDRGSAGRAVQPHLAPRDRTAASTLHLVVGPLGLRRLPPSAGTSPGSPGVSPLALSRCRALGVSPIGEEAWGLSSPRSTDSPIVASPERLSALGYVTERRNPGVEVGVLVLCDERRGVQSSASSLAGALAECRRLTGEVDGPTNGGRLWQRVCAIRVVATVEPGLRASVILTLASAELVPAANHNVPTPNEHLWHAGSPVPIPLAFFTVSLHSPTHSMRAHGTTGRFFKRIYTQIPLKTSSLSLMCMSAPQHHLAA